MSSKQSDVSGPDDGGEDKPSGKTFLHRLDLAVKLTVPIGAVVASLLTLYIQHEQSSRETNNQREQSESNLRATMFGNLISPLVGKEGHLDDAHRYAVLVQLLALNFHEHFQFKPLMQHADDLLEDQLKRSPTLVEKHKIDLSRWALRSVAHRVIDSQLATLRKKARYGFFERGLFGRSRPAVWTFWLFSRNYSPDSIKLLKDGIEEQRKSNFDLGGAGEEANVFVKLGHIDTVASCVIAPSGNDAFAINFPEADWQRETVTTEILRYGSPADCHEPVNARQVKFELTPFSLPFTDNLRFPNGNRIAVFMRDSQIAKDIETGSHFIKIQVIWFPSNYDLPMELVNR